LKFGKQGPVFLGTGGFRRPLVPPAREIPEVSLFAIGRKEKMGKDDGRWWDGKTAPALMGWT